MSFFFKLLLRAFDGVRQLHSIARKSWKWKGYAWNMERWNKRGNGKFLESPLQHSKFVNQNGAKMECQQTYGMECQQTYRGTDQNGSWQITD